MVGSEQEPGRSGSASALRDLEQSEPEANQSGSASGVLQRSSASRGLQWAVLAFVALWVGEGLGDEQQQRQEGVQLWEKLWEGIGRIPP